MKISTYQISSYILLIIGIATSNAFSQSNNTASESQTSSDLKVVFYNVENLFDTYDNPDTKDDEFTPRGEKYWNYKKYYKKLHNTGKTLLATGGWNPPELIGLCEVENRKVLEDLTQKTALQKFDYDIIHKDSPDRRGIDVAVLYQKDKFEVIKYDYTKVEFPFSKSTKTRELLYVKGLLPNKDTLHFFVNHWPSRWGGQQASEPKRVHVAKILRGKIDSLLAINKQSKIIITGDFNDEPEDKSVASVLLAKEESLANADNNDLVNLMYPMLWKSGTHSFQGHWGILDHLIVSSSLLNENSPTKVIKNSTRIFDAPWLLTENAAGGRITFRTFRGPTYIGGFSDHLPIMLDLNCSPIKKNKTPDQSLIIAKHP